MSASRTKKPAGMGMRAPKQKQRAEPPTPEELARVSRASEAIASKVPGAPMPSAESAESRSWGTLSKPRTRKDGVAMISTTVSLPEELVDWLSVYAAKNRRRKSHVIADALMLLRDRIEG